MVKTNNGLLAAVCLMSASVANTALAEDASASAPAADASSSQITDIVVTANRRSERAQTVPIAVTAISGMDALNQGVTNTLTLANAVPGLRIDRAPAATTPFLRGVGSGAGSIGSEPSVSLYVDDVYTPSAGAFFSNFNNVDRIEVLKGPQGTLFGRNATGGVIQVFTRNPTPEPKLDLSVGYASYDTVDASAYASTALAKNLSMNVAVYGGRQGEGWGKNLTTGNDSFEKNWNYGGRVKLLYEPSDDTSVLIVANHDTGASSEGFYRAAPGTVTYGAFPGPVGFYDMVDDTDPYYKNSQTGVSAKVTQSLGFANLVSISAYKHFKQFLIENQAGSQFPFIHVGVDGYDDTFTQELQLLSREDSPISWMGGLFYMNDEAAYDPLTLSGLAFPGTGAKIRTKQSTDSYSAFGQATVPIMENVRLTGGLRYTVDDRELEASSFIPGVGTLVAPNSPQSKDFSKLTWRLALDYRITPDVMFYASYNRGFRSGGFNTVVFPGAPIAAPVEPETLDAYAIGEKAEFFDRRLQFNAEAFIYDFKNIQVQNLVAGGTVQSNAAAASIKGIDVDVRLIPIDNLTLTASAEFLDSKYDSYPDGSIYQYNPGCAPFQSSCQIAADLKGFKLPFSAPFSASLSANYLVPTSVGNFNFNVSYNHGGKYYFNSDNGRGQLDPSLNRQRTLDLVNASMQWTSSNEKYDIQLWGRNITDQEYLSLGGEQTLVTSWGPAAPATYGITLSYHPF